MGVDLFARPSTEDTGVRNANDYYETPAWMVAALLQHHPIAADAVILEPCAGDGAIARALQASGRSRVMTNDLDRQHQTTLHLDATEELWSYGPIAMTDWVITNPPFNAAFPILEQAELLARVGVAMLLRKTFLEPTRDRGPWLSVHPPTHIIGLPRHRFRGKGQDSVSADWMIWRRRDRDVARPFIIDHQAKQRRCG